jgi:hypothetical protein
MDAQGIAAIIASVTGLLTVILPSLRILFTRIHDMHDKTKEIESNVETLLIRTDRIMKELRRLTDGKYGKANR